MIKNKIIDEKILDGLDRMCDEIPQFSAEIYVNLTYSPSLKMGGIK